MERGSALERFMAKVDKSGDCWPWTGPVDRYGYGKFSYAGQTQIAHRWAYEALVGPIPEGLTLDHLCHSRAVEECASLPDACAHRRCVNPEHLEPVTRQVNRLRAIKPECPQGHAYTAENTWIDGRGFRNCRICRRARGAEWVRQARQKARVTNTS